MSLWKVRHPYSPFIEGALIALAVAYGIFAIYLASVKPLVVALTSDIGNAPAPITLDTDEWSRSTNVESRYLFGVPKGWIVEASNAQRVAVGRSRQAILAREGGAIVIETRAIGDRNQIENIAADEIADARPALYDVSVHGRPGLFAVEFENGRIVRQTVYVQVGERVHIIRAGSMDPAAFSAFVSTVKFLPEIETE